MKKSLIVALALLVSTTGAFSAKGQTAAHVVPGNMSTGACPGGLNPCFYPSTASPPVGYQQLTSLSSATALTVPTGAVEALIVCETQTVRWRDDGTNPTASVGMPLQAGVALPYVGTLSAIKIIETTASATCNISYYK